MERRAAETALIGVRAEARHGRRTTLDALNAAQEAFRARVSAADAERDAYLAALRLLQSIGLVTPPPKTGDAQ
ncbi:MAG: hypothetical protein ACFB00_10095 [Parvularculaceae bacterium]